MTYDEILKRLEDYQAALAAEERLARTGVKAKPALSAIRSEYADLFTEEAILAIRGLIERAPQAKKRDQMERVMFALLEGMVAETALPIEEQLLAESAELRSGFEGEEIAYHDFTARIGREEDFGKREALRALQSALAERLTPLHIELEHAVRQKLATFGFKTMREYCETKKCVSYEAFLQKTLPILEETTGLYRRVMSDVLRRSYGKDLGELGAAHAIHWRAGREFGHLFPAETLLARGVHAFEVIGVPFERAQRITIDDETRPGKCPRAGCYAPHAPEDIHLILKPQGGYEDLRAFLHEGAHALHLAGMDPALPYEWRGLPRSHALGETYAFLVEHLPENPLWLEHVLQVPKGISERLAAWALLGDLFRLRRYVAKFSYELALDEKPYDVARNKTLYAKTLKDLTGFVYEPEFFMEDTDGAFYSADYLRAWIASAQLEEHLVRRFGDRWFLKRDTGGFLKELFAKGDSWSAEELVQSLGMTSWDPFPLLRKFDGVTRLLR